MLTTGDFAAFTSMSECEPSVRVVRASCSGSGAGIDTRAEAGFDCEGVGAGKLNGSRIVLCFLFAAVFCNIKAGLYRFGSGSCLGQR